MKQVAHPLWVYVVKLHGSLLRLHHTLITVGQMDRGRERERQSERGMEREITEMGSEHLFTSRLVHVSLHLYLLVLLWYPKSYRVCEEVCVYMLSCHEFFCMFSVSFMCFRKSLAAPFLWKSSAGLMQSQQSGCREARARTK